MRRIRGSAGAENYATGPHHRDNSRRLEQITATGGCSHPVHLTGSTTTLDGESGEILHHYDTHDEPGERLLIHCRNRRATVCPACSRLHAGDTYHLVRTGLLGGKNIPITVRHRPRLFVTLTAPSFGPVHRAGERCRPRRDGGLCPHGHPLGCGAVHAPDSPAVGRPLCSECYDYTRHVLWHAHASKLWDRFVIDVRRRLASSAGLVQSRFAAHARLSFARVAEYQKQAAVHIHAVVRLDGRSDGDGPDDDAVAAYVAKYVTKGADETGAGTTARSPRGTA
ncbi:replication initiator [Streptomyces sp. NPDC057456]|uniref:replication initiator n=1 Tax=Streptomyces sp. NPDC057456 TaxID=3346139 RepID=UPI0036798DDC